MRCYQPSVAKARSAAGWERIPEGLNTNSTGVVKTLGRGGRCGADWFDPRGEPRCSLEDRSCQGMVLTAVSSAWQQDGRHATRTSSRNVHCTRAALSQRDTDRHQAKTHKDKRAEGP